MIAEGRWFSPFISVSPPLSVVSGEMKSVFGTVFVWFFVWKKTFIFLSLFFLSDHVFFSGAYYDSKILSVKKLIKNLFNLKNSLGDEIKNNN